VLKSLKFKECKAAGAVFLQGVLAFFAILLTAGTCVNREADL